MRLYAAWHGDWSDYDNAYKWIRLGEAARDCGLKPFTVHRARADALTTRMVLQHVAVSPEVRV